MRLRVLTMCERFLRNMYLLTVRLCYAVARMLLAVDTLRHKRLVLKEETCASLEYSKKIWCFPPISSVVSSILFVRIFQRLMLRLKAVKRYVSIRVRLLAFRLWHPYALSYKILVALYGVLYKMSQRMCALYSRTVNASMPIRTELQEWPI